MQLQSGRWNRNLGKAARNLALKQPPHTHQHPWVAPGGSSCCPLPSPPRHRASPHAPLTSMLPDSEVMERATAPGLLGGHWVELVWTGSIALLPVAAPPLGETAYLGLFGAFLRPGAGSLAMCWLWVHPPPFPPPHGAALVADPAENLCQKKFLLGPNVMQKKIISASHSLSPHPK